MKKETIFILIFFLISLDGFANTKKKRVNKNINFFVQEAKNEDSKFSFNKYEHFISGIAAFTIGNTGYLLSKSAVLKLAYSGIQTIGIINIGRGVYQLNSPSIKKSFSKLLTNPKVRGYTKPKLANELLETFAQEARAKRLSLFYSSSFLTLQYIMNATIYDSPKRVKNIYIFLGGINAIIASYTAFFKTDYEKFYYGEEFDISPFAFSTKSDDQYGLNISFRF